jgi:hypothetical protein
MPMTMDKEMTMTVDYVGRRRPYTAQDWMRLGWPRERAVDLALDEHGADAGFAEVVRVQLDDGGVAVRPLAHVVRHSPDGLEWGYGGSGPADLALSILCDHLGLHGRGSFAAELVDADGRRAVREPPYQDFKREQVATKPRVPEGPAGWRITDRQVAAFLTAHGYELTQALEDRAQPVCRFCDEHRPAHRYHQGRAVCEECWDPHLEASA